MPKTRKSKPSKALPMRQATTALRCNVRSMATPPLSAPACSLPVFHTASYDFERLRPRHHPGPPECLDEGWHDHRWCAAKLISIERFQMASRVTTRPHVSRCTPTAVSETGKTACQDSS